MAVFWDDFGKLTGHSVPKEIIDVLIASGYDNSVSVAEICEEEILTIEKYADEKLRHFLNKCPKKMRNDASPRHKGYSEPN